MPWKWLLNLGTLAGGWSGIERQQNYLNMQRFEVLTAVLLMIQVIWDIMPCQLVNCYKKMWFTRLTDKLLVWSSFEQREFTQLKPAPDHKFDRGNMQSFQPCT
jgi:hypothetical protein